MESESNTVEITDSGNKYRAYFLISLWIFCLVITNVLFVFVILGIQVPITDILGLILLILLPLNAIFLYLIFYVYGYYIKISKVIISAKTIEIIHGLRRHPTIINWSDFDTIRIKIKGLKSHKVLEALTWFQTGTYDGSVRNTGQLLLKFSRYKPTRFSKIRNLKLFHNDKIRQIIELLISNAEKHGKNIDIERRTKNYYFPTD